MGLASESTPARVSMPAEVMLGVASLLALLIWSYWPVLVPLWGDWRRDPNYSVGMLVPLGAAWLLWNDRTRISALAWRPSKVGLGLMLAAFAIRALGQLLLFESVERYSLVAALAGLVVLFGGIAALRRLSGVLLFLLLMFPLPGRIHSAVSLPLQRTTVTLATQTLELAGLPVLREGTALTISNRATLNITEGCSGFRLLTAFAVVAALFALLVNRPNWQRWVLLISAVPTAIVCNALRIVATAVLCTLVSSRAAETFFHDFAGVSMMPIAVLMLWAVLRLLDWLTERPAGQSRGAIVT